MSLNLRNRNFLKELDFPPQNGGGNALLERGQQPVTPGGDYGGPHDLKPRA